MHANARRPSGGISVMVKQEYRQRSNEIGVKFIKEDDCFIWMKLCKSYFNMSKDVYLFASYIPPEGSTFYEHNNIDPFTSLEESVMQYQSLGDIVLLGDLNARTGELKDYIVKGSNDFVNGKHLKSNNSLLDNLGRANRNNQDTGKNRYGNSIIELYRNADVQILNCRTMGNLEGAYTSFQYNGRSVVDYCIMSDRLFPAINTFMVSTPNHLSDHAYICTKIQTCSNSQLSRKSFSQIRS
jgi:exonuclease III